MTNILSDKKGYFSKMTRSQIFYVLTGVAHEWQLKECIDKILEKNKLSSEYKVLLAKKRDKYLGYAFVWVDKWEIYELLTHPHSNFSPLSTIGYKYQPEQLNYLQKLDGSISKNRSPKKGYFIVGCNKLPDYLSPMKLKDIPSEWISRIKDFY